jgi:hypothetical protein
VYTGPSKKQSFHSKPPAALRGNRGARSESPLGDESFSEVAMDWIPWSLHPTGLDYFLVLRGTEKGL